MASDSVGEANVKEAQSAYKTVDILIATEDNNHSSTTALTSLDALNLPSDAPLVVIQHESAAENEDDEADYQPDPKLAKTFSSKVDFHLKCEWRDCPQKGNLLTGDGPTFSCENLASHVEKHLVRVRDRIQKALVLDDSLVDGQADETNPLFKCLWEDCDFVPLRVEADVDTKPIDAQFEEFSRHVFFHVFHSKIKFLGSAVTSKNNLEDCQFDVSSRNLIPDLPNRLLCEWNDCGTVFDNPILFYKHVASHVLNEPSEKGTLLKCLWRNCIKSIRLKGHLKQHLMGHTQEKCVGCPRCGGMFANKTKFFDHLKRQQNAETQVFLCEYCSKKFGLERLLRDHMRQHVNHYKCPFCDLTCAFPANLRHHIQYKHSDYRPHSCPQCPYRAKTQYDLNKHLNNHELDEVYRCDVEGCKYSSVSLECLKSHQRSHDLKNAGIGNRKYQCHECLKEFTRGTTLTTHLRSVHDFKWPEELKRVKYILYDDGFYRLQEVRYESIELTQQMMRDQQRKSELSSVDSFSSISTPAPESSSTDSTAPRSSAPHSSEDGPSAALDSSNDSADCEIESPPRTTREYSEDSRASEEDEASDVGGRENLSMLGEVASLLSPTKRSLPQRKGRGKRKKHENSPPLLTPSKKIKKDSEDEDVNTLYKLAPPPAPPPPNDRPSSRSLGDIETQTPASVNSPSDDSPSFFPITSSVRSDESGDLYRLPTAEFQSSFGRADFLASPEDNVLFRLASQDYPVKVDSADSATTSSNTLRATSDAATESDNNEAKVVAAANCQDDVPKDVLYKLTKDSEDDLLYSLVSVKPMSYLF